MGTDISADLKQENFGCCDSILSYTISTSHVFGLSLGMHARTHARAHTHTHTHTHTHITLFCSAGKAHALTRVKLYEGEPNEDIVIF